MSEARGESDAAPRRAVVAAGTGRYSDPWHPFLKTSQAIAGVLADAGWQVSVDDDLDGALTRLDGVDLLVVNAGDPWRGGETGFGAAEASTLGLTAAVDAGIGILAVHNAVSTLRDHDLWRALLAGEWQAEVSWHPPIGPIAVPVDGDHAVTAGIGLVEAFDELYTDLHIDPGVEVLAAHVLEGRRHPLVWVREHGMTRVVVSAFGHDERSFESESHRMLLRQAAAWAARRPA
ncbi:ThuA domain-containing protein [Microbacterium sp. NPDC019599]|uniref:ThuA domain-containing protein n=1 Tax=Microbacterium sp. NPDC019599 TaxID=3154690 RepID=UPI0033C4C735